MDSQEFNKFIWNNARTYVGFENMTIQQIQDYYDENIRHLKQGIFDMNVALVEVQSCPDDVLAKQIDAHFNYKKETIEESKEKQKASLELADQISAWNSGGLDDFKAYLLSTHTSHYDGANDFWFQKTTIEEERKRSIEFCMSNINHYKSTLENMKKSEFEVMTFLKTLNFYIPETPVMKGEPVENEETD